MTLPDERTRAVILAESVLRTIAFNPKLTRREIKDMIHAALRHYPTKHDLLKASVKAPDVFARPASLEHDLSVALSEALRGSGGD